MSNRAIRRMRLAAIVALVTLVAPACAGATADSVTRPESVETTPRALPLVDSEASGRPLARSDEASTSTSIAPPETIAPDPYRTWIATANENVVGLTAYEAPGGPLIRLPFFVPNPHQFGGPLTLMVTEGEPGDEWVQVQLPIRPNSQEGWIRTSDYVLSSTRIRAEVDLSEHRVVVFDGPSVIAETEAVVGTAETPTPVGTFFIAAKKENGEDEYFLGPWALVLSGFSEALETFSGGLPVIAVHGTHRPEQIGQSLSNGCIRIPNDVITFLAENVPLGAPITISI